MIHLLRVGVEDERILNVHYYEDSAYVETDKRIYRVEANAKRGTESFALKMLQWLRDSNDIEERKPLKARKPRLLDLYQMLADFSTYTFSCDVVEKFESTGTIVTDNFHFNIVGIKGDRGVVTFYIEGHYAYAVTMQVLAIDLCTPAETNSLIATLKSVMTDERTITIRSKLNNEEELTFLDQDTVYRIPVKSKLLLY